MKTFNTLNGIAYILLTITGITYVGNKLLDLWAATKVNTDDLPETNFIKEDIERTTYPEGYDPEKFNEWSQYIHKQLN